MARAAKGRGQQQLFDKYGRATWRDGKRVRLKRRRKPGRKPKGKRAGSPHRKRPELKRGQPVHVVLRAVDEVGSLRRRYMYKALREATIAVAKRELAYKEDAAFRIVHLSMMALSRGMQSFQISAAKQLNRALSVDSIRVGERTRGWMKRAMAKRRRGTVFPDRFHQEIITCPQQARRTLAYVLNNWRKHREDQADFAESWKVDPYSTGVFFDGWKEREGAEVLWKWRETYDPLVVYFPKSWLLREGWRKHGLVELAEVPSSKQRPVRVSA